MAGRTERNPRESMSEVLNEFHDNYEDIHGRYDEFRSMCQREPCSLIMTNPEEPNFYAVKVYSVCSDCLQQGGKWMKTYAQRSEVS